MGMKFNNMFVDVKASGQANCTLVEDEKGRELHFAQQKDFEILQNIPWKIKCLKFGRTEYVKFRNLFF